MITVTGKPTDEDIFLNERLKEQVLDLHEIKYVTAGIWVCWLAPHPLIISINIRQVRTRDHHQLNNHRSVGKKQRTRRSSGINKTPDKASDYSC